MGSRVRVPYAPQKPSIRVAFVFLITLTRAPSGQGYSGRDLIKLLFRQFLFDALFHSLWFGGRFETADNCAFAADEELGEVPLDVGL